MTITITLNEIKFYSPCRGGWEKLLKSLGKTKSDNTAVTFSYIAENNNPADALWCLRVLGDKYKRERLYLFAEIAESVAHIYNEKYPDDNSVNDGIQAIKDYADMRISLEDLKTKRNVAPAADADAYAAAAAAHAAARAADAAAYTAYTADATDAANAAAAAAHAAARAADAAGAEREKQIKLIRKWL